MTITQEMRDDYPRAQAYDEHLRMNKIYDDFELALEGLSFSESFNGKEKVDGEYKELATKAMGLSCNHLKYEILCLKKNKLMAYVDFDELGSLYEDVKGLVDLD